MLDKAFDPFSTDEIPSKGYLSHLFWEQDLFGISSNVNEVLSYFLDQVCDEHVNGIHLVSAWITAVRDNSTVNQSQIQFPTTGSGYPLFPVVIDIMQVEPSIRQSALAFYMVADPDYGCRAEV